MPKQAGPVYFTGTVDGLIFYKLGENYYVRRVGHYKSRRQMRRLSQYERTLENADTFGQASRLSKWIYYGHMPKCARTHGAFGKLTGKAYQLLKEGKCKEDVEQLLKNYCLSLKHPALTTKKRIDIPQSMKTRYLSNKKEKMK